VRELAATRTELAAATESLTRSPAHALRDERTFAPLEARAARTRRAGWCLGVLAHGLGDDLLGARREREGLRWFVAAAAEADGLALDPGVGELPELTPLCAHPAEVALLAAWCVRASGGTRVRWRRGKRGLVFELSGSTRFKLAECAAPFEREPSPVLALAPGLLALSWS
jgi:hypothetical protein